MLVLPRLVVVVVVMVINIPVSSGCYNKKHRLGSFREVGGVRRRGGAFES